MIVRCLRVGRREADSQVRVLSLLSAVPSSELSAAQADAYVLTTDAHASVATC